MFAIKFTVSSFLCSTLFIEVRSIDPLELKLWRGLLKPATGLLSILLF